MNDLKTYKIDIPLKTIIILCVESLFPAIITYVVGKLFNDQGGQMLAVLSIVNPLVCIVVYLLLSNILKHGKIFREYKEYEGKWIQIIPEFQERPVSIIDFTYSTEEKHYILKGINFEGKSSLGVPFYADKIVDRKSGQGFYYITNYTREQKNGLGKIGFIQTNVDNLVRAEGYFIDVSNEQNLKKYNTILIKYDKNFVRKVLNVDVKKDKCISMPSDYDIYKQAKTIIEQEKDKYKKINNSIEQRTENV